uniref:Protein dom34 n=1 Tax=Lygus hesperus TaxID=30085 RepID=A0A0A9XCP5_LYGHE
MLLKDKRVLSILQDRKFVQENQAVTLFFTMLEKEPSKVCYGYDDVCRAFECCAIDTLLICDTLTHSLDTQQRAMYEALVEGSRRSGITVYELSTRSDIGRKLERMTGVAAILRFSLHYIHSGINDSEAATVYENFDEIR